MTSRGGTRLRVDPVACAGIGMCAHLAEDLVRLDSWGYPVVPQRGLDPDEARKAARAVTGCPRRALRLADDEPQTPEPVAAQLTTYGRRTGTLRGAETW